MGLRCKPGDVCMVHRACYVYYTITGEQLQPPVARYGTFVTVTALGSDGKWNLAEPIPWRVEKFGFSASGEVVSIADDCLTPYRPWEAKDSEVRCVRPLGEEVADGIAHA